MQSLSRALRRGNAVLVLNQVTKTIEPVERKHSTREVWRNAKRESLEASADRYCENITRPLTQEDILRTENKKLRHVFSIKNNNQ